MEKTAAPVEFKKHVIMLFWDSSEGASETARGNVRRLSKKYPSVKVRLVEVRRDPQKPQKHNVTRFPTIVLLKSGREVERLAGEDGVTLLEQLFRKAHT
jgi:hypothetical protein